MSERRSTELEAREPRPSPALARLGIGLLAIGAVLSGLAWLVTGDTDRVGFAYLWGFALLWTVVLGGLFFVALQHVTRSVWSVVVRRVAEMLVAPIWLVPITVVPVVLFAVMPESFGIFPWAHGGAEESHALADKASYLNPTTFVMRTVAYVAIWLGFARYFLRGSLVQDRDREAGAATARMRRAAGPFMVVFAFTATFAAIDWLMSLEPHWFSTIFGVYVFSGMVVAALSAITIATIWLRSSGRIDATVVTDDHLYNLGALLFAFVCFWAYIAFSQYMLIWYANVPEESFYIVRRLEGGWKSISVGLALARFVVPFLVLLSRRAKTNPRILVAISLFLLAGQVLDLYWLVMPQSSPSGPVLGWAELGPPLLLAGAFLLVVARFMRRHSMVASGDPGFEESRRFHLMG